MRVKRSFTEKEATCPSCLAELFYEPADIHLIPETLGEAKTAETNCLPIKVLIHKAYAFVTCPCCSGPVVLG